jgi:hypothetical protein
MKDCAWGDPRHTGGERGEAQIPAFSSRQGRRSQLAAGRKGTARCQKHDRPRCD